MAVPSGLLLALGAALAAILAGSAVLPAVGGLMGAWRLASVGYKLALMFGSGRFTPVEGAGGDVLKCVGSLWLGSGCRTPPSNKDYPSAGAPPSAPGACRLDLWWRPVPVVLLPLSEALVREQDGWVLVDAGAGDNWSQAYATK